MPTRALPDNPSLEWLKNQAKSLHRAFRAGDPDARVLVAEFDPRAVDAPDFALTNAQLVIARSYDFPSWPKLHEHVELRNHYTRFPEPPDGSSEEPDAAAFLRLACLNYTRDSAENPARARALLAAHPDLATADVYTMAATGEAAAIRRLLAEDPTLVRRPGGPFGWEPLDYLAYGRLGDTGPGRSAVDTARVLLQSGADPNSGYLWHGMPSPFTTLTGVLGGGEQDQPPHPDAIALGRLLLEAGADPNDNQALYNRMFRPADDHLELLFDFGLGTAPDGPWRQRLGSAYPTPRQMIEEQLRWAADNDMPARVRLLLAHGVDPDGLGYHPIFGRRTAYELAVLGGNQEIAQILAGAGADTSGIDAVAQFLGACTAGDRAGAERLAADPAVRTAAQERRPEAVARAARTGRVPAVGLLLDLGFDVNAGNPTALHEAAHAGNAAMVELLLAHGADPTRRDGSYDGTPADWARHGGHEQLAEDLRARE